MPLQASRDLPLLPSARVRALLLLHNPDATIHDFVQVFASDPALSVAALTAANSAASAPVQRVASVRDAVVRIGGIQARHIAVSAIVRSQFDTRLEESWIDVGAFWEHLVVVGLLTEALAQAGSAPGVPFTAGFLHDIGRLALVSENPMRYRQVLDMTKVGVPAPFAERRLYGVNHITIGQQLAERWNLPHEVVTAAGSHHERGDEPVSTAVFHARRFAWKLGYGDGVVSPDVVELDDETLGVAAGFGGEEGLRERVRWYSLASAGVDPEDSDAA